MIWRVGALPWCGADCLNPESAYSDSEALGIAHFDRRNLIQSMTNLHGQHEVLARQGAAQLSGRARAHDRCCDARGGDAPRESGGVVAR